MKMSRGPVSMTRQPRVKKRPFRYLTTPTTCVWLTPTAVMESALTLSASSAVRPKRPVHLVNSVRVASACQSLMMNTNAPSTENAAHRECASKGYVTAHAKKTLTAAKMNSALKVSAKPIQPLSFNAADPTHAATDYPASTASASIHARRKTSAARTSRASSASATRRFSASTVPTATRG